MQNDTNLNENDVLINIFGEEVVLFEETGYTALKLNIVNEAKSVPIKDLQSGDVYIFHFKKIKHHSDRPGVIVRAPGVGPYVMVLGSTKNKKWQKYDANILVRDWEYEGLKEETFAYTNSIVPMDDVTFLSNKCGSFMKGDYDNIIAPAIASLKEKSMNQLLTGKSFNDIYKDIL